MKTNLTFISPASIIRETSNSNETCDCSSNQSMIITLLVFECIQFISWLMSIFFSYLRVKTKREIRRKLIDQQLNRQSNEHGMGQNGLSINSNNVIRAPILNSLALPSEQQQQNGQLMQLEQQQQQIQEHLIINLTSKVDNLII